MKYKETQATDGEPAFKEYEIQLAIENEYKTYLT